MTTKIPVELSSTPGIVDGSNATAITIDSSENVTLSGDLTLSSATANKPVLTLTDTNADSQGPDLVFRKDSSSPADNDELFRIYGYGDDDAGNATEGFLMLATMTDVSNGSEDTKVRIMTYGAGSQRDTLTLAGLNVGIGTASPDVKLHVYGGDSGATSFDAGDLITIENNDSLAFNLVTPSTKQGLILFSDNGTRGVGLIGYNHSENSLRFHTSNAERMRILSTGLVAIGTTVNTVAKTHIVESESRDCLRLTNTRNPSSSAPYVATFGFNYQPNNGTSTFLACQDDLDGSPTNRLVILSNGGIANYQSNNSNLSDARLKTNIQDAPNALDIINNLKVRTFKYHDQTDEKIHTGLIAQEAETVDLSIVNQDGWSDKAPEGEEPYKSIYSTDLMFKMLKAIQEQQEQIEQLKTEIQTLKGE